MAILKVDYLASLGTRYYLDGRELVAYGSLTNKSRVGYILNRALEYGSINLSSDEEQLVLNYEDFILSKQSLSCLKDEERKDWYYEKSYENVTFRAYTKEQPENNDTLVVIRPVVEVKQENDTQVASITPASIVNYQIVDNHVDGFTDLQGKFRRVSPTFDNGYIIDYLNGRVIDRDNRDRKYIIINRMGGWILQWSRLLAQEVEKLATAHKIDVHKYLQMPIDEIQCFKVLNSPLVSNQEVLAVLQFYMTDYYATVQGKLSKSRMDNYCLNQVV